MPVFVVIEGIPDIGKSHLVNALSNRLTNMKKKVLKINEFASDEYEIIFLRAIEKDAMSEISITLLSIINIIEKLKIVKERGADFDFIVMDTYMSNLIGHQFQRLREKRHWEYSKSYAFLSGVLKNILIPADLGIYLQIDSISPLRYFRNIKGNFGVNYLEQMKELHKQFLRKFGVYRLLRTINIEHKGTNDLVEEVLNSLLMGYFEGTYCTFCDGEE